LQDAYFRTFAGFDFSRVLGGQWISKSGNNAFAHHIATDGVQAAVHVVRRGPVPLPGFTLPEQLIQQAQPPARPAAAAAAAA
jgi:hypothetical protein